jgi:hypothetical protein
MRIVHFAGLGGAAPDEASRSELEAALSGDGHGPAADAWRELREDVRSLAPPIDPEFEQQLRERILREPPRRRSRQPHQSVLPGASSGVAPAGLAATAKPEGSAGVVRKLRRGVSWHPRSRAWAGGLVVALGSVVAATIIVISWNGTHGEGLHATAAGPAVTASPTVSSTGATGSTPAPVQPSSAAPSSAAEFPVPAPGGVAAPGHVQQRAATISLAATPDNVQATADRVSRLAVSIGGFVQNSQVQVQQGGPSEATLVLKLPSARLSAALASLGQLAPVRGESQSLQDITDASATARRRLADAVAERQAALHALSQATTQEQIDRLRERLAQAGSAIAEARSAVQAVSQRASTADVEVTVVGDAHVASEGLTLHRGLHDAGRVLTITLAVLLIATAILVPLILLLGGLLASRRVLRRHQRERTLNAG